MTFWQIFMIVAVVAFVLEMFTPTMFFLSIAVAALITAVAAYWWGSLTGLIILCSVLSVLLLLFVRPLMKKLMQGASKEDGFKGEYVGKVVKVISEVTKTSGTVAIYGEKWEARLADENAEPIPEGAEAKIISNESIVLYVEKV